MNQLSRDTRLQIMLDEDELSAIDTWRFARRMPSRAAAIRELLRIGLQALNNNVPNDPQKRSQQYGVLPDEQGELNNKDG